MLRLHWPSAVIGTVLSTAIFLPLILLLPTAGGERYQIAPAGNGNLFVLDRHTNRVSLLIRLGFDQKKSPDWPWTVDHSFAVGEALTNPVGAQVDHGVPR